MFDIYSDYAIGPEDLPSLPLARIVWALDSGREIISSGVPGMAAEALAASVIAAGIVPEGTPWREVDADYTPAVSLEATIEAVVADYETRVQARLDDFARTKTYENMLSACTYATSTVPVFRVEGQYCVEARDATWIAAQTFLNTALAAVMAGERDIPAWEEVLAELPVLAWPEGSRG